jgi:hypothetical protein
MKGQLLNKIQSSEQSAGIAVVVLAVLSLFMSLVPLLMLAFLTLLVWTKPQRFVWVVLAYACLPTAVAFASQHAVFSYRSLVLLVLAMVAVATVIALKRVKPMPVSWAIFGLSGLAFALAALSSVLFPGIAEYWRSTFTQMVTHSGLNFPADVLEKAASSNLFAIVTGEYLALAVGTVLLSIGLGLAWASARTSSTEIMPVLSGVKIPKVYAGLAVLYVLVLSVFHPVWLLAGAPVLVVPLVMAGLSLCLAFGRLRQLCWVIIGGWLLILLALLTGYSEALLLMVLLYVALLGVIVLSGFVDALFDFRARAEASKGKAD